MNVANIKKSVLVVALTFVPVVFYTTGSLADFVVFPAAEWNQGQLTILGEGGNISLPFYGPENGLPSEFLSINGFGGTATLFGSLVPSPAISAGASSSTAFQVNSYVELVYHVEIIGPQGLVDMHVNANETTAAQGTGEGVASFSLLGLSGALGQATNVTYSASSGITGTGWPTQVTVNNDFLEQTGSIFAVQMGVSAATGQGGPGYGYGVIDPIFSVPAGYTLEFSSGVGNSVSAVPEPSAWTMMLLGFTGLGFAGYRQSKRKADVALSAA